MKLHPFDEAQDRPFDEAQDRRIVKRIVVLVVLLMIAALALWGAQMVLAGEPGGPPPLPHECVGVGSSDVPPVCCAFGYVYHDGAPVAGAGVTIQSLHGSLITTTAGGSFSGYPYYQADLSSAPLSVSVDELITVTATYTRTMRRRVYQVTSGGQQVDLVLSPLRIENIWVDSSNNLYTQLCGWADQDFYLTAYRIGATFPYTIETKKPQGNCLDYWIVSDVNPDTVYCVGVSGLGPTVKGAYRTSAGPPPRYGSLLTLASCPVDGNVAPYRPGQVAPADGLTLTTRSVTLRWRDWGDPDNYPDHSREYSATVRKSDDSWRQDSGWTGSTSWPITVPSDGTYRWRVQARDGVDSSDSTAEWEFVVNTSSAAWTFMLYLAGDNNLDFWLQNAVRRLEEMAYNPHVNVLVLQDGPGSDDTWRYFVQPGGNYTDDVNRWHRGELNMGDPRTLSDFILWARSFRPTDHYYLAIADHGRGTTGIAWDNSSGGDYLTPAELGTALDQATSGGANRIDVIHHDACLMAMIENAYQVKDYADYLVASENIGWGVFAYDQYAQDGALSAQAAQLAPAYDRVAALVTASTTPRQLAISVADNYYDHPRLAGYPRTVSALDLGKVVTVTNAVNGLAAALQAYLGSQGDAGYTLLLDLRDHTVQKFDSLDYYTLDEKDEYVDLYDLARVIGQNVSDSAVQTATAGVMAAIGTAGNDFVVAERHYSGEMTDSGGTTHTWNLGGAYGVSTYFPPISGGWGYGDYVGDQLFAYTVDSQWDEFLAALFAPLPPPTLPPTDPGIPAMPSPGFRVYLPAILK